MIKKSKYEKVLISITLISIIGTLLCKSIFGAYLESSNAEIQRIKKSIERQEQININMQMKINELTSLDNTLDVADDYGLSYNNGNIKVVGE